MYHIKTDKRSQSSAEEIVRGLEECLQTRQLKSITVSDIHRATGISRATFYRLFDTPEDVLHYQFVQMAAAVVEKYAAEWKKNPDKLLEAVIEMGMQNNAFLQAVVENGRFDLLYQYTDRTFRLLDKEQSILPSDMAPIEREYLLSHLSMAMVANQITWTKNGCRETPLEVVGFMKNYVQVLWGLIGES